VGDKCCGGVWGTCRKGWVQIVHALALDTAGGKQKMNCENTEGAFR